VCVGVPGDPAELELLAARIAADAEELRGRAGSLAGHAAAVNWESTAAGEFRQRVSQDVGALRLAAAELDCAAAELRRHAVTVRERAQFLAREAARVVHGVERAAGDPLAFGIGTAAKKLGGLW
jgi:hypothetical protein